VLGVRGRSVVEGTPAGAAIRTDSTTVIDLEPVEGPHRGLHHLLKKGVSDTGDPQLWES
jgi:hypothetical protein